MKRVALLTGIFLAPASTSAALAADDPTASEILARTAKVYASAKSYTDVIKVKGTTTTNGANPFVWNSVVETAFRRPDDFRFAIKDDYGLPDTPNKVLKPFFLICSDKQGVKTKLYGNAYQGNPTRSFALTGLGIPGRSQMTSIIVPPLLYPGEVVFQAVDFSTPDWNKKGPPWDLTKLKNSKRLDNAKVGAAECYRIEGIAYNGGVWTVSIDTKTLLILRIDVSISFGVYLNKTEIEYEPRLDPMIDDAVFKP